MSVRDAAWAEASGWFAKADQDVRAARLCLADEDLAGVAAYHCQQAAEKLLKGLLVAAGVPFRRTHELDELVTAAGPCYPDLAGMLDGLRPLSYWCWAFRYPALDPLDAAPPSAGEIDEVLGQVARLATEIGRMKPS